MPLFAPFSPLAQMNTTIGGAGPAPTGSGPALPVGSSPAPVAPVNTAPAPAQAPATSAATSTATSTQSATAPDAPHPGIWSALSGGFLPIILMFVALYFFLFRGQRKEEKRRKSLISEIKKGDRVMTIGGMLARVVSVDGDEVVLKIDESANVKATYRKSAIQEVVVDKDDKK